MNNSTQLKVGFARVNVNPPMGINLSGYFVERIAQGILDDLEINTVAVSDGKNTVLLCAIDNCAIPADYAEEVRKAVSEKTGVSTKAIYIHATHTHTGPTIALIAGAVSTPMIEDYKAFVLTRFVDVCAFALADLKPAKMGYGVGQAPNIAFIRRFRMKDGSVKTNPGVNNPDIVHPIGDVDEDVSVIRFDREGASTVVLVNFADHPDTVGGNFISGDWPTLTRHFVEKAIENTNCIFFNGAQGDVNHVNVHPKGGDFNGLFEDFDGCSRGYDHAIHMARVVTGGVLQVYDKVTYTDNTDVKYLQKYYDIPANKPDAKDLPLAHKYNDLHNAGRDDLIPFEAMELTTVVAEAGRMVRLENAPDNFSVLFSVISIGNVALFGIPGEPFNGVGKAVKKANGYDMVIPTCITNSYEGYYPMQDAYDEGGYEARSSNFKAGVAEKIIDIGLEMLEQLKK